MRQISNVFYVVVRLLAAVRRLLGVARVDAFQDA